MTYFIIHVPDANIHGVLLKLKATLRFISSGKNPFNL